MGTKIMVDTEKIESVKRQIAYKGAYHRLYEIDEELNNTWKGVDSDKFSGQLKEFRGDFDDLDANITSYITFLNSAKKAYDAAQDDITTEAGKLTTDY